MAAHELCSRKTTHVPWLFWSLMVTREVVISSPVRTAIGAFNGSLKDTPAAELGGIAVRAAMERSGLDPALVESVVMGNVVQAGNRMNPARQAGVLGGVPVSANALTVNRVCGSGAQAVVTAAQEIWLGFQNAAIAGGMENMDRAPYLLHSGRWGGRMGATEMQDSMLFDGLHDAFSGQHSGWHTEDLVAREGLGRDEQDRWAERSQRLFAERQAEGDFAAEITEVRLQGRKGTTVFSVDEPPRPDTTFEALQKLRPAFRPDGSVTAGNSPGLNSGAAAMVLSERAFAEAHGLVPSARLVSYGLAALEPGNFGFAPVPAVRQALSRAGWVLGDVEQFEINEAFAAVPIVVARHLGLPEDVVNVEGGALAHGHPIGATGAVLVTRLVHSMRRRGTRRGVVTLCIGGGQGIALALELV